MSEPIDFLHACRLPDEADNVAIAAADATTMGRLYRTGDRVRWLTDGNLDFLSSLTALASLKLRHNGLQARVRVRVRVRVS